jgi:hypothetical protein
MPIPAYYDAPDHLEGSVAMRGDDPRHDAMLATSLRKRAFAPTIRCGRFGG